MGKQTTTTACGLDYKCVSVCVCSSITERKTTVIFRRCYNLCENASFLVFLVCQQDIGTHYQSFEIMRNW